MESAMDTAQATEEDEEAAPQEGLAEDAGRSFTRLPVKDRAEISRDLGIAFLKTKSLSQALSYLQKAYRLEPDLKVKAQLNKEIQQIRFTQRRQAANRVRQPEIHSELEQQHLVRPRLPEQSVSSPPRPQGQVRKGDGQ